MPTRLAKGNPFSQPRQEEESEIDMTTSNSPVDSATALINRLITQIEASRQQPVVTAGTPGKLDFSRAAATILCCAESVGLTPALTTNEAEELARAFIEGDDGP